MYITQAIYQRENVAEKYFTFNVLYATYICI